MQIKIKKRFCTAMSLFLILLSGCSAADKKEGENPVLLQEETEEKKEDTDTGRSTESGTIIVYVCGEVQEEGVVTLPAGSRVYEAIELAGGMTEDAAASRLNLAEVLADGAKIYVPGKEESVQGMESAMESPLSGGGGKINLNLASVEELMTLSGIGETRAEAIIRYRTEHGRFSSIEEIKNVSGIKDGIFDKIKDKITV